MKTGISAKVLYRIGIFSIWIQKRVPESIHIGFHVDTQYATFRKRYHSPTSLLTRMCSLQQQQEQWPPQSPMTQINMFILFPPMANAKLSQAGSDSDKGF